MPELPEVETTLHGIRPYIVGRTVAGVIVRNAALRWPVPQGLAARLTGRLVQAVTRRAKYLLLAFDGGSVIMHLGMSGSLRLVERGSPPGLHDHLDIAFDNELSLRLRDPRRFGCVLWVAGDAARHRLLRYLGPEPLSDGFDGAYLLQRARGRRVAVKNFLMDARVVVGVGNIYASEALYRAGVHPLRASGRISAARYQTLAESVRATLTDAIDAGGTTLRDFCDGQGRPGYFSQRLQVYGRAGEPCERCTTPIRRCLIGQRASYYCVRCQR